MLLILTSEKDLAADFLIVRLLERSLPYCRLNVEDLANSPLRFSVSNDDVHRTVQAGTRAIDLKDVTAVWYRRAIHPPIPAGVSQEYRSFVAGELRHLWTGSVLNPEVKWVNPIDRVFVAEHKLFQLQVARRLGMEIPKTIVSNCTEDLTKFVREIGKAICKPIFHGLLLDGQDRYSVYTRRVTADSLAEEEPEQPCPVLLQEEIQRQADLRVTFVGDECFVAEITSADPALVDWRRPGLQLQYSTATMSASIESKCRTMLAELGLKYGAFDFIKTPDGRLVFLEVNPTGEWAWLEGRLGFPMRDAFIRLFFGDRA